jgi:hypothetical protein
MDFENMAIGGVALIYLVPGLIEFAKKLGLAGTRAIVLVGFVLGVVFAGTAAAIGEGLIPEIALPWVRVAALSLGGGVAVLSSMGHYAIQQKRAEMGARQVTVNNSP